MRAVVHKFHLWCGLIFCIPVVMMGLTGSILTFEHQIEDLFTPSSIAGESHTANAIIEAARAVAPEGFSPAMYHVPFTDHGPAIVSLAKPAHKDNKGKAGAGNAGGEAERLQLRVDPVSLAVSGKTGVGNALHTISQLHGSLLLRDYGGRSIVGWFGVAMLVFGLTGPILWWPKSGRWRRAFTVRKKSRGLRLHRDLHGAAGIWSVLLLITLSATGVSLAFPHTVDDAAASILPSRDLPPPNSIEAEPMQDATPLTADEAVELAQRDEPGTKLVAIALPAKPDQPYRVSLARDGEAAGNPPIVLFIDPWTKNLIEKRDPRDFSAAENFAAWKRAVHTGQAFGRAWHMLVFLAGFLPMIFAFTGISMWILKRQVRQK